MRTKYLAAAFELCGILILGLTVSPALWGVGLILFGLGIERDMKATR